MQAIEFDKGCYAGAKIKEHSFKHFIPSETIFAESFVSDWRYHQNPTIRIFSVAAAQN
jgi:AraC family transcriptional regulator